MDFELKNQVVLITGGAGGVAAATTKAFCAAGAKVAITYYKDKAAAEALVQEMQKTGAEIMAMPYDLGNYEQAGEIVQAVLKKWNRLDALVANAVQWPDVAANERVFATANFDNWVQQVSVNAYGTAAIMQKAVQQMLKQNYGRIVFLYSEIADIGMAGSSSYGAAKAAVRGLIESLRWEVGPQNVLITMVSPGFNMTKKNLERFPDSLRIEAAKKAATQRLSVPEDVAPAILFLASKANRHITGDLVSVSGGFSL